jgi:hypothetical protein
MTEPAGPAAPSPDDISGARRALGQHLAELRHETGLSQRAFAPMLRYSRGTLSGAELGQHMSLDFWQRCDRVLNAGGELVTAFLRIQAMTAAMRRDAGRRRLAARFPPGSLPAVPSITAVVVVWNDGSITTATPDPGRPPRAG